VRKILIVLLASGVAATPALAATKTVKVGDDWFVKKGNGSVTVKKGTTVKWKNVGDDPHSVTVDKGPVKFEKSTLFPGKTYSKKVTKKGTYKIICTIHNGQKMTLKVN
jgi:plastocyanin